MKPRLVLMLVLCSFVLGACAREGDNEARLFLERYDAVLRARDEGRAAALERLTEIPILDDDTRRVRDRCVEMHGAVLRASSLTSDARARVEAAEAAGGQIAAGEHDAIEAMLARAQAAADTADRAREGCQDGVARLRTLHPRRR